MGALSMGGKDTYRIPYLPIVQQVQHVEYGVAADVRKAIKNLTTVGEKVAAVILEPIQGEAGIIIPPKGYLKEVREICDEYGVCLIFDEIQTGMGRTGTMFRCETEGVTPDILTYGKAFGGGIMPITGIIARPHLWTEELQDNPWILGSPTFGGNPLACSAAIATIDFMLRHDIPRQAKEKGDYLIGKLRAVQAKYPRVISDIRGLGLMIGVEFPKSEIGYIVAKGMFARRVMTAGTLNNSKVIRFEPAATTSYEDFDIVAERFEQAVAEADTQLGSL
jgi:putrescine aminotransferase